MTLESILAALHLLALLTMVVFLTSEAALCRAEWLNGAVVERLARVDLLYGLSSLVMLATGLARSFWGIKGMGWYWSQPLLHLKVTLFVIVALLSIASTMTFLRWRKNWRANASLPDAAEIALTRKRVMRQAHIVPLIVVLAALLAHGSWLRT